MAKTQEEFNQLKTEYETSNNKLQELSEEELKQVIGGTYNGSYRFELEQRVREKAGNKRIGKISKHDSLSDREAYVVWFSREDYPNHWGNYHCYADELEAY